MNSHKIGSKNRKNTTFKYISLFLFGILFALMATQAFSIVTGIENAVQYVKQIVLTSSGTAGSTTGVILDGPNSRVGSTYYCAKDLTNCKQIDSLVTTGELTGFIETGEINTLSTTLSLDSCSNGQIPKFTGSSRSCGTDTDTDKYFSTASFNTSDGTITLSGAGGQSNVTLSLEGRYRTGTDLLKTDTNGASILNGNIGLGINSSASYKLNVFGGGYFSNNLVSNGLIVASNGVFLSNNTSTCYTGLYGTIKYQQICKVAGSNSNKERLLELCVPSLPTGATGSRYPIGNAAYEFVGGSTNCGGSAVEEPGLPSIE